MELAIVTLPEIADEKLECEPVWIDQLVVVMAGDHDLAGNEDINPELLLDHVAILPSPGTFTRKIINNLFAADRDRLKIVLETNYLETIRMMVAIGLGWSALPKAMLDKDLREVKVKSLTFERTLGIVQHANRSLSNAGKAFIKILEDHRGSG